MTKRLVLVVDDEAPVRLLCKVNLEHAGYRVLEAANGEEGVATARVIRPDAILLDVQMPILNGIDSAAELRADATTMSVPILFLTPRREFAECLNHLALSNMSALHEPFNPMLLPSVVHRLISTSALQELPSPADLASAFALRRVATTPNAVDVSDLVVEWQASLGEGNELVDGKAGWAGVVDGRICPVPQAWRHVYEEVALRASARARGSDPPMPLILDGWHYSSAAQKAARWAETVRWARTAGCVSRLTSLVSEWHFDPDF